jgi:hypothetical protein
MTREVKVNKTIPMIIIRTACRHKNLEEFLMVLVYPQRTPKDTHEPPPPKLRERGLGGRAEYLFLTFSPFLPGKGRVETRAIPELPFSDTERRVRLEKISP